jgi:hypothetical protein
LEQKSGLGVEVLWFRERIQKIPLKSIMAMGGYGLQRQALESKSVT